MKLPNGLFGRPDSEACHLHVEDFDSGIDELGIEEPREGNPVKRVLKTLGPGLITGASNDDPTAVASYSVAGASFGYSILWVGVLSYPIMAAVQFICAKIGLVTGVGLVGALRQRYSLRVVYPIVALMAVVNTVTVGVNIGAIAAAVNLLIPIPFALTILGVTAILIALMVFGSYRLIARIFKWFALLLLTYVAAALLASPDWGAVIRGSLIPTFKFDTLYITAVVAILGTNLSPFMFFWQASQEVEEEVDKGRYSVKQRRGASNKDFRATAWDINVGMAFSQMVVYFITLATAATLFVSGNTEINSAAEAAIALRPLAGDAAYFLFAIGLIGSGFLAVPVMAATTAYAVAEIYCWRHSLAEKPSRAREFYAVMGAGMALGALVNFVGINPIQALFFAAALNGVIAGPTLALVMLLANDKKVMGEKTNGFWLNLLGWGTVVIMSVAAISLALTLVT